LDALGGPDDGSSAELIAIVSEVLGEIRKAKSDARLSMKAEVKRVVVDGAPSQLDLLKLAQRDLCEAGQVKQLEMLAADVFRVRVELS
jgi:valyl-tRNA synthetase